MASLNMLNKILNVQFLKMEISLQLNEHKGDFWSSFLLKLKL